MPDAEFTLNTNSLNSDRAEIFGRLSAMVRLGNTHSRQDSFFAGQEPDSGVAEIARLVPTRLVGSIFPASFLYAALLRA